MATQSAVVRGAAMVLMASSLALAGCSSIPLVGGSGNSSDAEAASVGIGVNAYLWRASLDTLSFMPLNSADPFGGVVLTDWYSAPDTPQERFKVQVFILDKALRADGIRLNVFRQERAASGLWADAQVTQETKIKLENAILTRARQLRIATITDD